MPKLANPPDKPNQPTSFRLTPEAIELLSQIKKDLGFKSRDDVVELALRTLAGWIKPPG